MLSDEDKAYVAKLRSEIPDRDAGPLPADAENVRSYLYDFALDIMKDEGQLRLVAMLFLKSGMMLPMILDDSSNQDAKDNFAAQVRALTVALDVNCVSIVMEAWVASPESGLAEIAKSGISHLENKREVVFISSEWADTATMWAYGIDRDDNGGFKGLSVFQEYGEMNGKPAFMPGRFGGLMAPQPVPSPIRQAFKAVLRKDFGEIFDAEDAAQAGQDNKLN